MFDETFDEEYEIADDDQIIRAQWCMDGATTLAEAAEMLRTYADWLESKEYEGWRLRNTIEDDYGYVYLVDPNGNHITGAILE